MHNLTIRHSFNKRYSEGRKNMNLRTLDQLNPWEESEIIDINPHCPIRRRLQDIGFIKDSVVKRLFSSPLGDPVAYRIKDTTVALRREDAMQIIIKQRNEE